MTGDLRIYVVLTSIAKQPHGPSWILTLIGVQCHEIPCSWSFSRGVQYIVLSPSVTRLQPRSIVSLWLSSFYTLPLPSLGGDGEFLSPWKNILGTVLPTSIWTHPPQTSVSKVTCVFCWIDFSLFLQVVLTGGALGNASDFDTADPAAPKSFMALTPVNVHGESSQSLEKASKKTPFYKRRWFLIFQVIACLVGIGLLFVLLFPVVKAIAQRIVDDSNLNVDRVTISEPTNTSYVPFPEAPTRITLNGLLCYLASHSVWTVG